MSIDCEEHPECRYAFECQRVYFHKPNYPVPARCNQDYWPSDLVELLWSMGKFRNKDVARYIFDKHRY